MWKIKAQPTVNVYPSRDGNICIHQYDPSIANWNHTVAIHPDALAEVIERLRLAAEKLRGPDVSGVNMRLPRDLKAALHETRPRRMKVVAAEELYGTDTLELNPLRELKVEVLKVRPQFGSLAKEDPHRSEDGYYAVPVVNLVRGDAYCLVWLPVDRRYGTYDREHTTLMVYPAKLTWTKLRADIEWYFGATNTGGDIADPEAAEYYRPWPTHPFVKDAE